MLDPEGCIVRLRRESTGGETWPKSFGAMTDNCAKMGKFPGCHPDTCDLKLTVVDTTLTRTPWRCTAGRRSSSAMLGGWVVTSAQKSPSPEKQHYLVDLFGKGVGGGY